MRKSDITQEKSWPRHHFVNFELTRSCTFLSQRSLLASYCVGKLFARWRIFCGMIGSRIPRRMNSEMPRDRNKSAFLCNSHAKRGTFPLAITQSSAILLSPNFSTADLNNATETQKFRSARLQLTEDHVFMLNKGETFCLAGRSVQRHCIYRHFVHASALLHAGIGLDCDTRAC